jgi:glutathione S-transferase
LAALTGQTSAPVALYADEKPAILWDEIIYLSERLGPEPRLIPADARQRMDMFGVIHELVATNGFGWCRRLQMFQPMMQTQDPGPMMTALGYKYGYRESAAEQAGARCTAILQAIADRLHQQGERGSEYLVGDELSAADIYWAVFASFIDPLPQADNPMPAGIREIYTAPKALRDATDAVLLGHRDMMYQRHLNLPLDY